MIRLIPLRDSNSQEIFLPAGAVLLDIVRTEIVGVQLVSIDSTEEGAEFKPERLVIRIYKNNSGHIKPTNLAHIKSIVFDNDVLHVFLEKTK
jgi:hypothetical protein